MQFIILLKVYLFKITTKKKPTHQRYSQQFAENAIKYLLVVVDDSSIVIRYADKGLAVSGSTYKILKMLDNSTFYSKHLKTMIKDITKGEAINELSLLNKTST